MQVIISYLQGEGIMKNRSIGEKLKRINTYETQQKVLSEWVKNWKEDQENVIKRLRDAATHDDHSEIMHMIQQLEGMTEKRFVALNNVMRTISNPERKLDKCIKSVTVEEKEDHEVKEKTDESSELVEEMKKGYNAGISLKEMARISNMSEGKVKKILVTANVYTSEIYDRIKEMRGEGRSDDEIAYFLGLGRSAMDSYTPYKKGIYGLKNPTENAKNIRKYRNERKNHDESRGYK